MQALTDSSEVHRYTMAVFVLKTFASTSYSSETSNLSSIWYFFID